MPFTAQKARPCAQERGSAAISEAGHAGAVAHQPGTPPVPQSGWWQSPGTWLLRQGTAR